MQQKKETQMPFLTLTTDAFNEDGTPSVAKDDVVEFHYSETEDKSTKMISIQSAFEPGNRDEGYQFSLTERDRWEREIGEQYNPEQLFVDGE